MIATPTLQSPYEEPAQHLLLMVIRNLVDDSDAVRVDCFEEAGAITLTLHVSPNDIGKVIGKQGRTARCLRTILSAMGKKLDRRYALDIEEENEANEESNGN
jgi:predicted RNA-binding protein YlqC (UPF0109 family)